MAKQSGLHQIKGKVGEHSYYQQTGVSGGLVRRINPAMSNKVKTDEAFVNTRLNNSEFGQAGRIAGVLGHVLTPKYRPMLLPFSQSKMAKYVLDAIKTTSGNWGQRTIPTGQAGANVLTGALDIVTKNNPADYGISMDVQQDSIVINVDSALYMATMQKYNAAGYYITGIRNGVQIGNYVQALGQYQYSYRVWNIDTIQIDDGVSDSIDIETPAIPPLPTGQAQNFELIVAVIMPYRLINSQTHILQEACTFISFAQPIA